jgi:predicted tellurium resistance membrane protein TerC
VDNIIFISILVSRLPAQQRERARIIGLALAMVMRIGLLLSLAWMMELTDPLFSVYRQGFSGRDLILLGGGLFLLAKSVLEIHNALEGEGTEGHGTRPAAHFIGTLVQIAIIDIVFSLDSVITAVGMVDEVPVMVLAIVIAVGIMMFAARPIGDFVDSHPTIKMLALSFLILIGVALVGEGFELHIPKGYIYFAMAFAIAVEMLNLRLRGKRQRGKRQPMKLRKDLAADSTDEKSRKP